MAGDVAVRQRDREQHDPRDEADRGPGQQRYGLEGGRLCGIVVYG
jgi:hypothetical protein